MEQLLEIHSVPIVIKYNVNNREAVEKTDMTADLEVSKSDDVVKLKGQEINVDLDSMRSDTAKREFGKDEYIATDEFNDSENEYQASANAVVSKDGSEINVDYKKILSSTSQHSVSAPKDSDLNIDQLSVQYEMDKVNFNMKMGDAKKVEFTPADVQFTIEQKPEVVVKYIGGPIYVPASADPDYEPEVDVKA